MKRVILPAAISESAAKDGYSPRPEVESSHKGDDVAGRNTEIDDRHEQNSAYSLSTLPNNVVPIAQLVRALVCGTRGCGFKSHWAPSLKIPLRLRSGIFYFIVFNHYLILWRKAGFILVL